jgi:hypothetical protein
MDCYIIASTLEGGWGFKILEKEDGLTREEEEEEEGKEEEPVTLDSYLVNKITES